MLNFEKHKDRILELNGNFAVDKDTLEILPCHSCITCKFFSNGEAYCNANLVKWLYEEYVEPPINWSKVPIDTKVLVSHNEKMWSKGYFAGVDDKGRPVVWYEGKTSWSADDRKSAFTYIKLAE